MVENDKSNAFTNLTTWQGAVRECTIAHDKANNTISQYRPEEGVGNTACDGVGKLHGCVHGDLSVRWGGYHRIVIIATI